MVLLRALGKLEQGVQHGCGVVGRWQRALLQSLHQGRRIGTSIIDLSNERIEDMYIFEMFYRVARFENTCRRTRLLGSSSNADYVVEAARLGKWVTARLRLRTDT